MINHKKFRGITSYVFKDDLFNDAKVYSVAKNPKSADFLLFKENLPVHTFRGGSWTRDIIEANTDLNQMLKTLEELKKQGR